MSRLSNVLKQWTGKSTVTVLYDSNLDEFTCEGLFSAVESRPDIAVVATTTDGDVFGFFYSVEVTEPEERFNDRGLFAFSLESHGRCMTPQRFPQKVGDGRGAYVKFWNDDSAEWFVFVANEIGSFNLGNERSTTMCANLSLVFEGLEDSTLTGKTMGGSFLPSPFFCTRLVAVQLT